MSINIRTYGPSVSSIKNPILKFYNFLILNVYYNIVIRIIEVMKTFLNKMVKFSHFFLKNLLNTKQPIFFILDIIINSSLLLCWIFLIKFVNVVPKEFRPKIFHRLCLRLDGYIFNNNIGWFLSLISLITGSFILYNRYYNLDDDETDIESEDEEEYEYPPFIPPSPLSNKLPNPLTNPIITTDSPISSSSSSSLTSPNISKSQSNLHLPYQSFELSSSSTTLQPTSPISSGSNSLEIENNEEKIQEKPSSALSNEKNYWNLTPPILLITSMIILHYIYQYNLTFSITRQKFIISWVFYVIFHFLTPILIGIWLHLFHVPGSLKLFSLSCGLQNVIILLTHLIFPNVPPLFIKLYGENLIPNYDMTYTDGITRQDIKVPTYMYKSVYYAAPNKFSCFPLLHLAMAVMSLLFVCHYARWNLPKILLAIHLVLQWWSSIYLDHHWRIDLLAGVFYSIFVFTLIKYWKNHGLLAIDKKFKIARFRLDFVNGSTFGMRLFKNTKFSKFFDPA